MAGEIPKVTPAMQRAIELVRAINAVQITEELHACATGEGEFRCTLSIPGFAGNSEFPARAALRVRLDRNYPYHAVDIFTEDREFRAFPHQDAETHKLCLFPDRDAPLDDSRLAAYLGWTQQWLSDVVTDQLWNEGDPYELPDFSRREVKEKLPTQLPVLFDESPDSFPLWKDRIRSHGIVSLAPTRTLKGLLVRRFWDADAKLIREWQYPDHLVDPAANLFGAWVLLPTPAYFRHRPPQKVGELADMCRVVGIDLFEVFRYAWEQRNAEPETAFVLVGAPIPRDVGGPPLELHWQPLLFANCRTAHRRAKERERRGRFKNGRLWNSVIREGMLQAASPLPWGRSDNVAANRLYARGRQHAMSGRKKVVIAGCGALGSVVAELLARGGVSDLCLLDQELFEMGNQCRHTLDGRNLSQSKAEALATRLQSSNPLSRISGYMTAVPPSGEIPKTREATLDVVERADLIVDCTADDGAFHWLDANGWRTRARVASLFVNFRATVLTMCVSGRSTRCSRVCNLLYADIARGRTPVAEEEHRGAPQPGDLVLPGAGCWHPTFPAKGSEMWLLASAAVNALEDILAEPLKTDGVGLLLRRNVKPLSSTPPKPPIEAVWMKKYR